MEEDPVVPLSIDWLPVLGYIADCSRKERVVLSYFYQLYMRYSGLSLAGQTYWKRRWSGGRCGKAQTVSLCRGSMLLLSNTKQVWSTVRSYVYDCPACGRLQRISSFPQSVRLLYVYLERTVGRQGKEYLPSCDSLYHSAMASLVCSHCAWSWTLPRSWQRRILPDLLYGHSWHVRALLQQLRHYWMYSDSTV